MVKLNHLAAIRFGGADAGSFLHNQLSADVLGLQDGDATFACYCEPKGRVLALMLVQKVADGYCVIMANELSGAVITRLKIYVMRSSVDIDLLSTHAIIGLQADDLTGPPLDSAAIMPVPGNGLRLAVSNSDIPAKDDTELQAEWKFLELKHGITWLTNATSGQFLPQMLGFDRLGAVNFRKGCYPGQEIVARTRYLGKVKRHPRLMKCKLSIRPQPMDKVTLHGDEQVYEANIADCASYSDGSLLLFTVARMDPDLPARRIEYLSEIAEVIDNDS